MWDLWGYTAGSGHCREGPHCTLPSPQTGDVLWQHDGHDDFLNRVLVAPDGTTVFSCGKDTTIRRWRISDGKLLRVYVNRWQRLSGEWEPRVEVALGMSSLIINALQLCALSYGASFPWWSRNPLNVAAPAVQLNFSSWVSPGTLFYSSFIGFVVGMSLCVALFALSPRFKDAPPYSFSRLFL